LENQPLVHQDCILTWDGRLDNREELRSRLGKIYENIPTDVDLVLACYKEWGNKCFAELLGDWSLALWDGAQKRLILARDYIGVRRLFYRVDEEGISWCTTLEPLVLQSGRKLHLDFDYLAGYLCPPPPLETTPYKEIRSVLPAFLEIFGHGGSHVTERYWALKPDRIQYPSDADYERHFREIFEASVARRLRADRTVLAELSGGLDSSSIVCVADGILDDAPGVALKTISYYDTDEASGDERPYFSLVEKRRGHVGHHISKSDFAQETRREALQPLPPGAFAAAPGYFAKSLRWASLIDGVQCKAGSRVTLSGLGGDEILGGVQYEAPELAGYLVDGEFVSFVRSLCSWALARKKTVFQLTGDTIGLLRAGRNPESFVSSGHRRVPWVRFEQSHRHRLLSRFADWHSLSPT
jgi:asparagine synthase (glutamine-hydrolysing)